MKRSTCASGSGYVPSVSIGFCVAITRNGSGTLCVSPAIVTWRSCITSSSALCTFAGARLISSASSRLREHRAERRRELAGLLVVDARADEVGRHEVGRELDAPERAAHGARERLDRQRLGEARARLRRAGGPARGSRPARARGSGPGRRRSSSPRRGCAPSAWRLRRALRSFMCSMDVSCRGYGVRTATCPTAAAAFSIGTAKPMPMNTRCLLGIEDAGDDADDFAVGRDQRPAGVARDSPRRRTG